MKNLGMILFLAFGVAQSAFTADGPSCVPAPSKLRVAVFDTTGLSNAPYAPDRGNAMTTALPQTAQQQNLDVMCLTELRDPELQSTVLQGFDPTAWNIYTPPAMPQTGCQDACYFKSSIPLQECANQILDQIGYPCIYLPDELSFQQCMATACPNLVSELGDDVGSDTNNPQCVYCEQGPQPEESNQLVINRCSGEPYNSSTAANCTMGYAGQAGTTLISKYPFVETDYHQFALPSTVQPGVANWGVAYAKIQTPLGPVHLFCSDHATSESGMYTGADQSQNLSQDQDLLNYINSKAQGEPAIYLADTGSGPAVASSPTGPANAEWPTNFTTLQSGLTDALLANVGSNFLPSSAAACTYGCGGSPTPGLESYVDHIMTSGEGTDATGYKANLCEDNGGTLFTSAVVSESGGPIPLSTHFGVLTEVHLAAAPFRIFSAPVVAIDDGRHPGFTVTATFTLSSTDAALQPATNAMTLQIANYTLTLPAGSFRPLWNGPNAPYAYTGTVNGTSLLLGLVPLGNNTFAFSATGGPVTFSGLENPVTVTLILGDDFGTASVKALVTTL